MLQLGLYQHFKGNYYKVITLAKHSETEQELVIYQAMYGDKEFWARPLDMFLQIVEHNGERVQRFRYCENEVTLDD